MAGVKEKGDTININVVGEDCGEEEERFCVEGEGVGRV